MRPRFTNEVKGMFHEVKGTIKEQAGKFTNNPSLESKGKIEKLAGKSQTKIGDVGRVIEKLLRRLRLLNQPQRF